MRCQSKVLKSPAPARLPAITLSCSRAPMRGIPRRMRVRTCAHARDTGGAPSPRECLCNTINRLAMDSTTNAPIELHGVVVNGQERISTQDALRALGMVSSETKPLVHRMHALGWQGPKTMRMGETFETMRAVQGYYRAAQYSVAPGAAAAGDENDLADALERVTRLGLREMSKILKAPLDLNNGNLVRSKVTAAIGAVNAQLRADEQRLRTKTTGDVL